MNWVSTTFPYQQINGLCGMYDDSNLWTKGGVKTEDIELFTRSFALTNCIPKVIATNGCAGGHEAVDAAGDDDDEDEKYWYVCIYT